MTESFDRLIEGWDGVGVLSRFDRSSGAWIFVCLHDRRLGPCTGGTRMKIYPSPADGLLDGLRLSGAMTRKWAAIGQPFGGGKAVVALARPLEGAAREALLRRYGRLVRMLAGSFLTGEDLGTTTEDLRIVAEESEAVQGFDPATGEKVDPSPYTARGVLRGIEAGLARRFGSPDPRGRTVLIEGIGNVGMRVAELLRQAGAHLLVSDLDGSRLEHARQVLGADVVPPEEAATTACDVYAPCAVGATLNRDSIPRLACQIVGGSANNQLADDSDAESLHERGILYLPDYVINSGGALSFALMSGGVAAGDGLLRRIDRIGEILSEILVEAGERDESPLAAAARRVESRLAAS